MHVWRLLFAFAVMIGSAASAQLPPELNEMRGPPTATPLRWKHAWLSKPNTTWDYVGREGRPLVINLPAAPAERTYGLLDHLWRMLYDEGYALGQLVWHDSRARTQSVRQSITEVMSEVAEVRADPAKFGAFDPTRMIVVAAWEDAFPASLLAFNSGPRASSPICAAIFINPMNLNPELPETSTARRRFSEDVDPAELSPTRYAGDAPPMLLLDDGLRTRSDGLAEAVRAAGGVVVQKSIWRFQESDPTTYLGYSENPSTEVIRDFLKTHCPAKRP